jgi:hypothetical protein
LPAVKIKTKEILALEVTDEKANDGKIMPSWLNIFSKAAITILKLNPH